MNCLLDERQSYETYWILDPIDGTRALIDASEFGISCALIRQSKPILGLLFFLLWVSFIWRKLIPDDVDGA